MSVVQSGLYAGTVMHHRLRPRDHRLKYRVFSLLLDLDAIDVLARRLRFFSRNRFNLFSFRDRDYGAGNDVALRTQVEDHLRAAAIEPDGGPILLLTMPRILGYAFNPLSVYFCYRSSGLLAAVLYEVNNTFGERHSYLIPVDADAKIPLRQCCPKRFHVSPFLDIGMTYAFRIVPPGERVAISITTSDADGPILFAALSAARRALSDSSLLRVFANYPLMTLKVILGIYWEGLLILSKGIRLRRHPRPPDSPITVVRSLNP